MRTLVTDQFRRVIDFTSADLEALMTTIVDKALTRQKHELEGENRYSTKRAAKFLGCTPGHMQKLHARGLPYEKGRPNQYRLTDLRQLQASQQVTLTA